MASIATAITIGTTLVSAVSQYRAGQVQANAARLEGQMANQAAVYEAEQLEQQAKLDRASAQISSRQAARQTRLLLSAVIARTAAGGTSPRTGSNAVIQERIKRYGTIEHQMRTGGGEVLARGREAQAKARRYSGRAALAGSKLAVQGAQLAGMGNAVAAISTGLSRFSQRPSQTYGSGGGGYFFGKQGSDYG